ncbi:hypothetical protein AAZX31_13G058800 [Glycine max]|uniref:Uncharacterized protein n=1 Tax=Glycine max TaxID=3847 RepID=A0A0R0GJM5_SOYBN|nr:hypothetical protein GYH30_035435 [Glycine max]KRH18657.1 hypothetical protein GLYMA_13G074300v4 [Glycine max]
MCSSSVHRLRRIPRSEAFTVPFNLCEGMP